MKGTNQSFCRLTGALSLLQEPLAVRNGLLDILATGSEPDSRRFLLPQALDPLENRLGMQRVGIRPRTIEDFELPERPPATRTGLDSRPDRAGFSCELQIVIQYTRRLASPRSRL